MGKMSKTHTCLKYEHVDENKEIRNLQVDDALNDNPTSQAVLFCRL